MLKNPVLVIVGISLIIGGFIALNTFQIFSPKNITVQLYEQSDSGVTGNAVLNDTNQGLDLKLELSDGSQGQAVVHSGTCDNLGPVLYVLADTNLELTVKDMSSKRPVALSVRRSDIDPLDKIACGEIFK